MTRLVDRFILFLFGSLLLLQLDSFTMPVVTALIGLAFLEATLILDKSKIVYILIVLVYIIAAFFFPYLLLYTPIVVYDLLWRRAWWEGLILLPLIFHLNYGMDWWRLSYLGIVVILAAVLSTRTRQQIKNREDYIKLQDTSTEHALSLKEKNKELIEKQDYEIHLATLSERTRIAREIHDNVGHILTRAILQLGALLTIYKEEPLQGQLKDVNANLNEAMNNIRESVHDLHDNAIDLKQNMEEILRPMRERYDVEFEYDISTDMKRNRKYCMIAIVKEAMSNIIKHSNATRIRLIVREHPGFYQLIIDDNGTIKQPIHATGIGLENMKQRVESFDGTIHFDWQDGFSIRISMPNKEETHESSNR